LRHRVIQLHRRLASVFNIGLVNDTGFRNQPKCRIESLCIIMIMLIFRSYLRHKPLSLISPLPLCICFSPASVPRQKLFQTCHSITAWAWPFSSQHPIIATSETEIRYSLHPTEYLVECLVGYCPCYCLCLTKSTFLFTLKLDCAKYLRSVVYFLSFHGFEMQGLATAGLVHSYIATSAFHC
jgi:hypothetical protein